ncbi:MAG: PAS domain S-box protein, partial [Proteobacteria bacterium]|nr:PAS domain S-box protein [Pseudomonadota bacterium]
ERYRELFDESPTAIWVEDWSAIKQMLDDLTRGGVKDWPGYFNSHRDQLMTAYNLAEVIDISSATVELYGQDSKEHLLQMTVAEAVIDEELDAFRDMVLSFLVGQMTVDIEAKDTAGDGSEIIVRRRVVVPPDHRDDWSRVIYAIEDITERKWAEEALRESEALFRDYAEASADWFWEMDTDLRFTYMSENVERILGVAPEWHYGKTRIDLLGGVYDRNLWQDHLKTLREHKPFQNFEYPGAVDGVEPVWTRISGVPVFAEDGAFLGYRGTGSNITEVKRTEEAIRTRDAWLEGIMENTPTQIVLKDIEGRIMAISQNAAEALGLSREDFIGHTTADFLPAEIADIYMNADREVIETDRLAQQEVAEENEDGSIRHMLSAKFPLKDGGGQILGVCSLTTDITEMKEVQSRLNQAQKMEAIGQLTGGIAHDFNNLLAIMLGNTELLWEFVGEHEQAKEFFETVIEMIDRGSSLTQRLLAFSRQSTLSPAAVDVTDLIGGLGVMLRRTLGETVDLRIEAPPDLWPATIDPHQFENALINLAVNARAAMPQGGTLTFETANITLDETYAEKHEEVTPGDYVVVAVIDSGTGMPPEVLEKVFEPFFTTKDVGKGSGLGLSMVYGFAKQSKGHITISSEVGQGTIVKLYMPRSEEDFVQEGAEDETPEFALGSERILVVEDDERLRAIPVRTLRKRGYEIVEAVDGKAAIKHLRDSQPFDLLFTDVVLPGGMNGVKIAEQANRIQPNIKVLYTTGYAENAVVHSGQLDPDVPLLNKPYSRAELLGKVRALLDSGDD